MLVVLGGLLGCGAAERAPKVVLTLSGSAVGAEGEVLKRQVQRFQAAHPEIAVQLRPTPDAADQRHQLFVEWLNAGAGAPDVLQLDVVWTPEFAAAGWIRPLDELAGAATDDWFAATLTAARWQGRRYALPLFIDAGMLYYRTDLVPHAPRTLAELAEMARAAQQAPGGPPYGLVWQGARYEGLVTVFLEYLTAHGGRILDEQQHVQLDSPAALRALTAMHDALASGLVPRAALGWQEEPVRFAFQNGQAVFMRNWPYAAPLLADLASSRVAGRFAVAPLPGAAGAGGRPSAALGGGQLAISATCAHPREAEALITYLTAPAQLAERARIAGQYPPRPSLYDDATLTGLPAPPAELRRILEGAVARPATPVYAELSEVLQLHLHRALSDQEEPAKALADAAAALEHVLAETAVRGEGSDGPDRQRPGVTGGGRIAVLLVLIGVAAGLWCWRRRERGMPASGSRSERALARMLVAPGVLLLGAMALVPLAFSLWDSFHLHDLRQPWRGQPFIGLANYSEALASGRFWAAAGHTVFFAAVSVSLELGLGLLLALALDRAYRGRGLVRAAVLIPWALPTVVAAMVWRFLFDHQSQLLDAVVVGLGLAHTPPVWLADPRWAWVPLILADVWKTTPFVTLLLLAGLQSVDRSLYDAARIDGATPWQQLRHITLPLLRPALLVALIFRSVDALRLFDLVYVLTGGGPGSATEPLALHAFTTLLGHLRFGYGAALAVLILGLALLLALAYLRLLGNTLDEGAS